MFDGLKEKLGDFREDAAEAAETIDEEDIEPAGDAVSFDADPEPEPVDADAEADDEATADGSATESPAAEDDDTEANSGFTQKAKSLAKGKFVIEEEDLEDPLWKLEMALIESDVEMSVAEELLESIRERLVGETRTMTTGTETVIEEALGEALLEVISVGQINFD